MTVVFAAFFGVGETIAHTVFSVVTLRHYAPHGKQTLYSPGFATAWCLLLPTGVYSIWWLCTSGAFAPWDLWGILIVALFIGLMIRLPFIISGKVRSTRFAYDDMGYLGKYEKAE